MYILERNNIKYKQGDIVLIHYWYYTSSFNLITPVKLLEKVGKKWSISHDITESKITKAPNENIKSSEIIDLFRK